MKRKNKTSLQKWNEGLKEPHTITALALKLGIARTTLYRWLDGQMPTAHYEKILAKVTNGKIGRIHWF